MDHRWNQLAAASLARQSFIDPTLISWWRHPARVRIALYAEGSIAFQGGSFEGLQHVVAALRADPWPWVKFVPVTIHRGADASADQQNKRLDQIDLAQFDELWLFGISEGNLLSSAELAAVHAFMAAGGGVLHTGDHASLGQGIAGAIHRVGKMRRYPAPAAAPGMWNNTLEPGPNGIYEFTDQSDAIPQRVRLKWYSSWSGHATKRRAPHPVLCGGDGPIDVFPDHQHEGEAVAPASYPAAEWPQPHGFQPHVEVIAWGSVRSPDAGPHREVGLTSVYDGHRADVGRIVADSTWHHWFDINLKGFGTAALTRVERYFLNVAAWLAPHAKQASMRNGVFAIALRRDPLVMLDTTVLHKLTLGQLSFDALGQFAPQCLVEDWLHLEVPPLVLQRIPDFRPIDPGDPAPFERDGRVLQLPVPFTTLLLAEAITPLLDQHREQVTEPDAAFDPSVVGQAFQAALHRVAETLRAETRKFAAIDGFSAAVKAAADRGTYKE